jgi:hypothetical protein
MSDKEIKQLVELAKQLKKEITKENALASFVSAGILDSSGDFTKPYKALKDHVLESNS